MAAVNPLGRDSVLGLKDIVRLVEDDLQTVMQLLRGTDLGIDMQFTNRR